MPWWIYSLVSNVAIIATEYTNRVATGNWLSVLPTTIPMIIIAQYCLFRTFNDAPHWFIAWGVFTVGNSVARVMGVGFFGESVANWPLAMAAIGVMMAGALLLKRALL
jgi:hypothetical protein